MTKHDTQPPFSEIRRQDRAKDEAWIPGFLHRASLGSMAAVSDGQPFIVPRNSGQPKS